MIIYLERREIGRDMEESDFARIFYSESTESIDLAYLAKLIPNGKTFLHRCFHDENKACTREEIV